MIHTSLNAVLGSTKIFWRKLVPFEYVRTERIAIIGSGISGLAAAYELSPELSVTVFEASDRLGGHARTVMAGEFNDIAVDIGFIVFNYPNYPNLTRMFAELDVPVKKSNMDFAASIGGGEIEYGLRNLKALFAQKQNILRPGFWRMILDIARFNRNAVAMSGDPNMTISELLDKMKMGKWFRDYYLLPISGATWSSTPEQIGEFPARSLVQFFENHALLTTTNHQWYTVDGGSIEYVNRIADAIKANGGNVVTGTPITQVHRTMDGVMIGQKNGTWEEFDQVIFACHSDDALTLLEAPTEDEVRILSKMRYQDNHAVLHRDENQMPQRKDCWSSWVFQSADNSPAPAIGVTYWMNSLQNLDPQDHLFVTLNPKIEIPANLICEETVFRHPIFDREAIGAQKELKQIQGLNSTWFCGAYTRNGFHEDGYASAVDVATKIREKVIAK